MRLSDVLLCALLAVIVVAGGKAVFFPEHVAPDTRESPKYREALARSLRDFERSDTVVDPYEATVAGVSRSGSR